LVSGLASVANAQIGVGYVNTLTVYTTANISTLNATALSVTNGLPYTMGQYQNWSSNVTTVGSALDQLSAKLTSGNVTANNVTVANTLSMSAGAILFSSAIENAAGTSQSTATPITADNVFVTGGTGGVILPPAAQGREISVTNDTPTAINVYPYNSHYIENDLPNTPVSVPAYATVCLIAKSGDNWWTSQPVYSAGTGVSIIQTANGSVTWSIGQPVNTSSNVTFANVTTGNINSANVISNNYLFANGTSIFGSLGTTSIVNGGSSVAFAGSSGNAIVNVAGVQIASFSQTKLNVVGNIVATANITAANISLTGNTGAPTNTSTVVAWARVTVGSTAYWTPLYQ
jgi:hypothetical protein